MHTGHNRMRERRRRIFEVAIRLFRERGFDAVTADEIAAGADCSRATVFNLFGSKAGVLRFFGQELEARAGEMLIARQAGNRPLVELRTLLQVMLAEVERHRESLKIVLVHSLQDTSYFSTPTPSREKILRRMADLIAEAQESGEARPDMKARALAMQIHGLYNNAVMGVLFNNLSAEDAMEGLWDFSMGGLITASRGKSSRKMSK